MTYTPKNLPAWQHRVAQFNAGSGQPPITVDEFIQAHLDEEEARHASQFNASLLDLMRPVGAEIAAAAGGDAAKIAAALEAGKTAALKTLA